MFGFGKKDATAGGSVADVIRCDEQEYLVWKWKPGGAAANTTTRENSIRWGSSLRVKDGEVAVFVYKQKDGAMQEFIVGPMDETIKTANFPVLSSILGAGFGGGSPFQAEIYFINLAGNIQVRFGVPFFPVRDPRFVDFAVPVSASGSFTFNITDYKAFIKLNRLIEFDLEAFQRQVKDALTKYVKGHITTAPQKNSIPVLALEERILELGDIIQQPLKAAVEGDFGVNLKRFDLSGIRFDEDSEGYRELRRITAEQVTRMTVAQVDANVQNLSDMQRIQAGNAEGHMRIQREAMERQQRLATEQQYIGVHQMNLQAGVAMAAAEGMGQMGAGAGMGDGGMNPGAMMAGMAVGSMVGGTMAQQMSQQIAGLNQPRGGGPGMPGMPGMGMPPAPPMPGAGMAPPPPPVAEVAFMVLVGSQQVGPVPTSQVIAMAQGGQINAATMVWSQGMPAWAPAASVPSLAVVFGPPVPPGP